ncbi:MAG: hypothetical protein ICV83_24785 [Cytophagales bacterium]|nr:hypothetical protein [Cytophagales bacterium]
MKWLYCFKKKWLDGDSSPLQSMYVRPTVNDEEGNKLVGKIIDLSVIATEYFMQDQFKAVRGESGLDEIYFNKLDTRNFYVQEEENDQPDLYLQAATLYIKEAAVTAAGMLEWTKVYFNIHGITYSEFEETDFNDFVDTNPVYTMIAEGARKMESKWGKEWWKTGDKKE